MKRWLKRKDLVEIVEGDVELVEMLIEHEILVERSDFGVIDVDRLLVARTLFRELNVNIEGIDVALHLREQLAIARRLLARLSDPTAEEE